MIIEALWIAGGIVVWVFSIFYAIERAKREQRRADDVTIRAWEEKHTTLKATNGALLAEKERSIATLRELLAGANGLASAHATLSQGAICEARGAIAEAVSISKLAAAAMFGEEVGEVGPGISVGQADRLAAIRAREAQEEARR